MVAETENINPYYDYFTSYYSYPKIDKKRILNRNLPWKERYFELMPYANFKKVKSIGEGSTPLIRSKKYPNCYFKDEARNPTGCFKDRESAVSIPYHLENGFKKFAIASSGNAALSASLYARLYGAETICYIPKTTSESKKNLIKLFGGKIVEMGKTYEDAYYALASHKIKNCVNITPGIDSLKDQGDKIIAYEIFDQLGVPDYIVTPIANGCLIFGLYMGFWELKMMGITSKMPVFIGVQLVNADPIAKAHFAGIRDYISLSKIPNSLAEGLVASESFSSPKALFALRETSGFVFSVREKDLKTGMNYAIRTEGLIPEWTSSSVFGGIERLYENGILPRKANIVALNTGSGLKDISNICKKL